MTELEKSRRKVSQKDDFLSLSARLFSCLRAGENLIASNPFLSTSLLSKILKSPPCLLNRMSAPNCHVVPNMLGACRHNDPRVLPPHPGALSPVASPHISLLSTKYLSFIVTYTSYVHFKLDLMDSRSTRIQVVDGGSHLATPRDHDSVSLALQPWVKQRPTL